MSDPDREIRRAQTAQRELNETNAAFDEMRQSAIDLIIKSGPLQQDVREEAYRFINTIDTVRTKLRERIDAGRTAEAIKAAKA